MNKTIKIIRQVEKEEEHFGDPPQRLYSENQTLEAMRRCSVEFSEWQRINAFQWGQFWRLYDEEERKDYTHDELFEIWEESK